MKFIGRAIFSFVLVSIFSCSSNKKADLENPDLNNTTIDNPVSNKALGTPDFGKDTVFNFGKIIEGEKVEHSFKFKNTGKGDLLISDVKAACGCTTPNWTKDVIKPGEEGFVKVLFDSNGRGDVKGNMNEKKVTVFYSTSTVAELELIFRAQVFSPENKDKQ